MKLLWYKSCENLFAHATLYKLFGVVECYGTHVGFGYSGTPEFHYESLLRRYRGCKHVEGNLEITNLQSDQISYDLSFLSTIEVVTGYVLLGLLDLESIPLTNLKLIRADNMFNIMGEDYGLVVAFTDAAGENKNRGLRELQLPSLKGSWGLVKKGNEGKRCSKTSNCLSYSIVVFSILFKNFEIPYVVKIGLYINDIHPTDIWLKFRYSNDVCSVFEAFDDKPF